MNIKERVIEELNYIPEPKLAEVLDFVRLVKARPDREQHEFALLSESTWARDWLRPEEDEAWRDL